MTDAPATVFGVSPSTYGIVSLVGALLTWGSSWLVIAVGVAIAGFVVLGGGLVSIASGLVGLGSGIYYRHVGAVVTSGLGLILVGSLVSWVLWSLKHF